MRRSSLSRVFVMPFIAGLFAAALGGCQVPGYVIQAFEGPAKTPAVYEIEDRPTVVFVEDAGQVLPNVALPAVIAARVGDQLVDQDALSNEHLVDAVKVEQLRAREPEFGEWSVTRIGRELGAEQVVWIAVTDFQLTDAGQIFRPVASAAVKVIDVSADRRIFPQRGDTGHPVASQLTYRPMSEQTLGNERTLARELAIRLARDAARLFHRYTARPIGSGFED